MGFWVSFFQTHTSFALCRTVLCTLHTEDTGMILCGSVGPILGIL